MICSRLPNKLLQRPDKKIVWCLFSTQFSENLLKVGQRTLRGQTKQFVNCKSIPQQAKIRFVAEPATLLVFFDLLCCGKIFVFFWTFAATENLRPNRHRSYRSLNKFIFRQNKRKNRQVLGIWFHYTIVPPKYVFCSF